MVVIGAEHDYWSCSNGWWYPCCVWPWWGHASDQGAYSTSTAGVHLFVWNICSLQILAMFFLCFWDVILMHYRFFALLHQSGWCSIARVFSEQSWCCWWPWIVGPCRNGASWYAYTVLFGIATVPTLSIILDMFSIVVYVFGRTSQFLQVPWWWHPHH